MMTERTVTYTATVHDDSDGLDHTASDGGLILRGSGAGHLALLLCGGKGPVPGVTVEHCAAGARRVWFEFSWPEQDVHARVA